RIGLMDLVAILALRDWNMAARLLRDDPHLIRTDAVATGALHLMAKRGDAESLKWLLEHGADPNARWAHWDALGAPLHLAALGDHADIARLLLQAGADPSIHDSKHDSDALGWAEFLRREDMIKMLQTHAGKS